MKRLTNAEKAELHKKLEEAEKAKFKPYENKIAELEKENAELKGLKDVATLIRANNDTVTTLMQLNNMLVGKNRQLNKAKEIIEKVAKMYRYSPRVEEIIEQAEQFLSEVEK